MPKPKLKKPIVMPNMNIPRKYLYTGNVSLLENYLASNGGKPMADKGPLNSDSLQHLKDRVANMKYIDELAAKTRKSGKKLLPKKADELPSGKVILNDIHQPNRQIKGWNCWTMPFILMLQSRGIELDQMTVLCSKPDLTEEECLEVDETDGEMFTAESFGNIRNLSGLLHKFVPNAALCQTSYYIYPTPEQNNVVINDFKLRVINALKNYGSPVALLVNKHYRTIVGIDGDYVILKDSYNYKYGPDQNIRVPISSLFTGTPFSSSVEISYVKDFFPKKDGTLPDELASHSEALKYKSDGTIGLNKSVNNIHTGTVQYSAGGQAELGNTVTVGMTREVQAGKSKVDIGEIMYLPPKADLNVLSYNPLGQLILGDSYYNNQIQEDDDNEFRLLDDDEEEASQSSGEDDNGNIEDFDLPAILELIKKQEQEEETVRKLSEISIAEDLYYQSLPAGYQKMLVEYANDSRQELRELGYRAETEGRPFTPEEAAKAQKCVNAIVASRLFDAQKVLGSTSEIQRIISEKGIDAYVDSPSVRNISEKAFNVNECNSAGKIKDSINDFIIKDEAASVVKDTCKKALRGSDTADTNKKLKAIGAALDPNHEVALLKGHLDNIVFSSSKARKNSKEYQAIKSCIENIAEIRTDMKADDPENASTLSLMYKQLYDAADKYMNMKNPDKFKAGSLDDLKYGAAAEVKKFALNQKELYEEKSSVLRENVESEGKSLF